MEPLGPWNGRRTRPRASLWFSVRIGWPVGLRVQVRETVEVSHTIGGCSGSERRVHG